jgi:hypothetical protein
MIFSRRNFIKFFLSSFFISKKTLAQSQCDIKDNDNASNYDEEKIAYWIDGPLHLGLGKITILFLEKQKKDHFISKVVLTDENNNLIETKYLRAQSTIDWDAPYLTFFGISDGLNRKYILTLKESEKIYRFVLDKSRLTECFFKEKYFPKKIFDQWVKEKKTISNFYMVDKKNIDVIKNYHYPEICLLRLNDQDLDGNFQIQVNFFSKNVTAVFITDPVGRLMGIKSNPTNSVVLEPLFNKPYINNCSFVRIFLEHSDGFFIQTILTLFT